MQSDLITSDLIGTTYTNDELISYLYLENMYLKRGVDKPIAPSTISAPSQHEVQMLDQYHVARAYLRKTAPSTGRHLILANEYPNYGAEYGNGFIHRRVELYKQYGADVDVMAFGKRLTRMTYNYKGVDVLSGYVHELLALLSSRRYESISVHFLNHDMWNVISPYLDTSKLYVFLHGYEVNRWIRRIFEYKTFKELDSNISRSMQLQRFWHHVVKHKQSPAKYVFVSKWWQQAVSEDMELTFPHARTEIIHNFIDTELFKYIPKEPAQRFKILWVRSSDARKYGNDLAIDCLNRIRATQYWDMVQVKIIGDGKYFHEFDEAFGQEANVSIEQRFASQEEIASLHRDYGLFLVPTRLDSQGVSRDEAMSSGLVPVTNAVTAIPEFADETCAVLAPAEDSTYMADEILRIFNSPELFLSMSENAAKRARSQCDESNTVRREAEMLGMLEKGTRH
ncbi:glycosyltransferase family 4 protein [Arthrobacter sp. Hor0625]|uniref:glycosyltransferase family 4 protein n=1 Tax=Arthrobacter sp. Hor0625 TaxID=3457358 RepID=UPI00403E8807